MTEILNNHRAFGKMMIAVCFLLWAGAVFVLSSAQADAEDVKDPDRIYQAVLEPVNTRVTGRYPAGSGSFKIKGDKLYVNIVAQDFEPGQTVMMHFHGFEDAEEEGLTPTFENMDANNDGVVDVVEIDNTVGMTMVPFNGDPAEMNLKGKGYPKASKDGWVTYTKTVDLEELRAQFKKKFGSDKLHLDRRHLILHGVPQSTKLPGSAESVLGAPAHATLPVSFGEIEMVYGGTQKNPGM